MSISDLSKNHGTTIGLLALSASIAFAAHGAFSRFDEIEKLASEARQTVQEVKGAQEQIKQDFAKLRVQFPQIGTEIGESGANAVEAMEKKLACKKDDTGCDDTKGLRGLVKNKLDRLKND